MAQPTPPGPDVPSVDPDLLEVRLIEPAPLRGCWFPVGVSQPGDDPQGDLQIGFDCIPVDVSGWPGRLQRPPAPG
jgi:hypothetical protein